MESRALFCRKLSGFTLVEVLLALLIVAVVGVSSQTVLSQLADQRFMLEQRATADRVVWNEAIQAFSTSLQAKRDGLTHELADRSVEQFTQNWRVSYQVEPTLLGTLERVEVSVVNREGDSGVRQLVFYR